MDDKIKSLESNDTSKLVDFPEASKLDNGKWVYSIKEDPDNPTCKAS